VAIRAPSGDDGQKNRRWFIRWQISTGIELKAFFDSRDKYPVIQAGQVEIVM